MDFTLTKYLTPNGYTVLVQQFDNSYRAATNDFDDRTHTGFYFDHIQPLPYRDTEKEAQKDLDRIASELNLLIEGNQ